MPLNEREINHTILDYNYKIEYPDGREITTDGGCHTPFRGYKTGITANATLLKTEAKISEKWDASLRTTGPSLGGSFGVKFGEEKAVAAIVEPSLIKLNGKVGSFCGSVGLDGTTGLQISPEGFKFGIVGFGITCGIGRRFSIDTPIVSGGFATSENVVQQEENNTSGTSST